MMNFADNSPSSLDRAGRWAIVLLMPWTLSVLIHLGIVCVTFFVVWSSAIRVEENNVIPEAVFSNNPTPESLVQTQDVETGVPLDVPEVPSSMQRAVEDDPLADLSSETSAELPLIGLSGSKPLPAGAKLDSRPLEVKLFGVTGDAETIVYCVDASGSLVDVFAYAINELKESLRKLSPQQRFTVIFFQQDRAIEVPVPYPGMKRATRENVKTVADWISQPGNVTTQQSSNPIKAIQLGFSYRPQLMYILSDNITGRDEYAVNRAQLLEAIQQAKRATGANTKINTIQFIYPDELETLKIIAQQHGGKYRFVAEPMAKQP